MKELLQKLELKDYEMLNLKLNNQRVIALIKNSEYYVHTKYIDIHHHFVQDTESLEFICLNYISMKCMTADELTKSLLSIKFTQFLNLISLK